jgi:YD repeat-containing protein
VWLHLLWLVVPLYFYARLFRSGAYLSSLKIAESSPAVQGVLGARVHWSGLPIGSALQRYNSEFAEWSVPLAGSQGSGRLYGVANRIGGEWEYSRLTVVPEKSGSRIDITPRPSPLAITPEHRKTVYLVPLDLLPEQSLDWAPAYYRARFDADVRILPPLETTALEWNESRHQLIAEKCIGLITRSHRDLATDASAVLIGVTSRDMYIGYFDWNYAENWREGSRLAVVSSARLRPTDFPGKWNKELLNSRLQKMVTKNLAILYFGLPLSNDYTSLLSAGILSGSEVDYMTERIVGTTGRWDPFFSVGEPMVTLTTSPGKSVSWDIDSGGPLDLATEDFTVDFPIGLFIQRKMDFYLDGEYPLEFTRTYRNADNASRSFGIGTNDSLDIFLVGQMGSWVDLVNEQGGRTHFNHVDRKPGDSEDVYQGVGGRFTRAVFDGAVWRVTSNDGWTYLFPYRPRASINNVTVLTGFLDPKGHEFKMVRDDPGDLSSLTTPSGRWLHFERDGGHRIRSISDSSGRSMHYEYDARGRLIRAADSDGNSETYTYDDGNDMLSVAEGTQTPLIANEYTANNLIRTQTLSDGRHFEYSYAYGTQRQIRETVFKHPNGLYTFFYYGTNGYFQSLPLRPAR